MTLKLSCPYCNHSLSLKSWKPGRFKPNCSACKKPFSLFIHEGDPPRIEISKIPEAPIRKEDDPDHTLESAPSDKTRGMLDATIAQPTAGMSRSVDETTIDGTDASSAVRTNAEGVTRPVSSVSTSAPRDSGDFSVGPAASPSGNTSIPNRIGGYRVINELGRGGMGSVYLAKQISLDRPVALKTIQSTWARDPRAIARFIREAYAAGQLVHHNVVQIYDLGQDAEVNFFSMELVQGGSLAEALKKTGKFSPIKAATVILQAARGLKFAHDHGMVHRDIKPANLMLTSDGMVKVADLGLVKTPQHQEEVGSAEDRSAMLASAHASVTGAGSTMGTPAYMSPEQAQDATNVDHRADIYSLGCTFYALLTGEPPFDGRSALEVITKHRKEAIKRPDLVVAGIPTKLSEIVVKMTAKNPDDRYQDLGDLIPELEAFISQGEEKKGTGPDPALIGMLEVANRKFNNPSLVKLRNILPAAFLLLCVVLIAIAWMISWKAMAGALLFALLTPTLSLLLSATSPQGSPIASRLRSIVFQSKWTDWLFWGVGGLLVVVLTYALGLFVAVIPAVVMAGATAVGYEFGLRRTLFKQRQEAVKDAEGVLKKLRLGGMGESEVRSLCALYLGKQWEELFESIFDYDSMRLARKQMIANNQAAGKYRFQPWRDSIVDRLDQRLKEIQQAKDQKLLSKVEQAGLLAQGLSASEASARANDIAATMVSMGEEARQAISEENLQGKSPQGAEAKRAKFKAMMIEARSGKFSKQESFSKKATKQLLQHLLGGKFRFALGSLLVIGCALWIKENDMLSSDVIAAAKNAATQLGEQVKQSASDAASGKMDMKQVTEASTKAIKSTETAVAGQGKQALPYLGLFNSFAQGVIGILIVLTSMAYGWRHSIFSILATATVMFGETLGIPNVGPVSSDWGSGLLAFFILAIGLFLGRMKQPD